MKHLRSAIFSKNTWSAFAATVVLAFASQALAKGPSFGYVPQRTAPQQELVKKLVAKKYTEALKEWGPALKGQRFTKTYTGRALHAYLMFESGMPVLGVEELMSLKSPQHIEGEVRHLWRTNATAKHPVWKVAAVRWKDKWSQVFPSNVKSAIQSNPVFALTHKNQLKYILKEIKEAPKDSDRLHALKWQLAQWAPVFNEVDLGLQALMDLQESQQNHVTNDEIYMTMGRILYQNGDLEEAIKIYNKVSKGSDYWIEALEEKAWAHLRMKKPGKALGELESVLSPVLTRQAGPEPFFLASLIYLKVCDFPQVFKTSAAFKKHFKDRIQVLQAVAKEKNHPTVAQATQALLAKGWSFKVISPFLTSLPRFYERDEFIRRHLIYARSLNAEANKAKGFLNGDDKTLQNTITKAEARLKNSLEASQRRVQSLAKEETKEFSDIIKRMHLVEAEVIQRIHRSFELVKNKNKKSRGSNVLVFPKDKESREVWLDELGHYQVDVKECLTKQDRKVGSYEN